MSSVRDYNAAVDFIDRNVVEGKGDKVAFIDPFRSITFRELRESAARVGPMLARLGIEPESRIAMVMLDTVEFPILFWGAVRAGIIPVLLNTRLSADQYRYLLEDSRAKAVFVSTEVLSPVLEAARELPRLKAVVAVGEGAGRMPRLEELLAAEKFGSAPARTSTDEVAYWLYSSGTTGNPKGVMHVHSSPMTMARLVGQRRIGIREDDVIFSAAKLYFSYGLGNALFFPLAFGATAVLYPGRPTSQTVFETLQAYKPTIFFAVPTLYASMVADPEFKLEAGSNSLRVCMSAGEPLPAPLGKAWKERFGVDIVNGIGSTEAGHLYLTNLPNAVEYGTSGVPVDGYSLKLVDDSGREVEDNELGELLVSTQTAASGYWNQREKTQRTFEGGWLRTGDRYVRRPDGVYLFRGRCDDMFKVSGIWVSPCDIEAALLAHPLVLEAAVVSAEDDNGLIKPRAFVVLKERVGSARLAKVHEELKTHVKNVLGPWTYPRWVEFVDSLPKTDTGKIQRYMLRDAAESRPAAAAGAGH